MKAVLINRVMWCAGLLAMSPVLAWAQSDPNETIENPEYTSWIKHPVGTTIITQFRHQSVIPPGDSKRTQTTTFKTREDNSIMLEIINYNTGPDGRAVPMTPTLRRVQRQIARRFAQPEIKPDDLTGTQSFTIEGLGDVIQADWVETTTKTKDSVIVTKVWRAEEVPGMVVMRETSEVGPTSRYFARSAVVRIMSPNEQLAEPK